MGEIRPEQKRMFSAHIEQFQLDEADLHALAVTAGNAFGDDITPDGISSLSLGATIFTNVGQFNNTPIFDLGSLRNSGRVDQQPGSGNESYSIQYSTSTQKNSESDKTQQDYSGSLKFGGWKVTGGYAQDNAWSKTSLSAASALFASQLGFSSMRLYPQDGNTYQEWSSYLIGEDITEADYASYVPGCPFNPTASAAPIKLSDNIQPYSGMGGTGANTNSPRAHYQAIVLMEKCFTILNNQYKAQSGGVERNQMMASLYRLANNINASIKFFYNKYGEAFVTTVRAYSMIKGTVVMASSSNSRMDEWLKSGTVALSYSGFFAGADAKTQLKQLHSASSAFNAQSVTASSQAIPNLAIDLNAYTTALTNLVKDAIANSNTSAALPSVTLQTRDVVLPDPRPLRDNPYIPQSKDDPVLNYDKYVDQLNAVKKEWTNPAEQATDAIGSGLTKLKDWIGSSSSSEISHDRSGQENMENLAAMVSGNRPGIPEPQANGEELIIDAVQSSLAPPAVNSNALSIHEKGSNSKKPLLGAALLKLLKSESLKLHQYGKHLKRIQKTNSRGMGAQAVAANQDNKIQFPNSRVYGFDATPTAAVLSGLRFYPDLPSDSFRGYPIAALLMGDLNRFRNVLTYINFMHSYSVSGLKDKDLFDNYKKFMVDFDAFVSDTVTKTLQSGSDLSLEAYNAILSGYISGRLAGAESPPVFDITKTTLYKQMGSTPQYSYIRALTDSPFIYKTISKGARGYIPIIPGSCMIDDNKAIDHSKDMQMKSLVYSNIYLQEWGTIFGCSAGRNISFDTNKVSLYQDSLFSPVFPVFKYEATRPLNPKLVFMQMYGNATLIYGANRTITPSTGAPSGGTGINLSGFQPPSNVNEITPENLDLFWSNEAGYYYENVKKQGASHLGAEWDWSLYFQESASASLETAGQNEVLTLRALSPNPYVPADFGSPGMTTSGRPMFSDVHMSVMPLIRTSDAVDKLTKTTYEGVDPEMTYLFLLPIKEEWLTDDAKSLSFNYGIGTTVQSIFGQTGDYQPVNNSYSRAVIQNFVPPSM